MKARHDSRRHVRNNRKMLNKVLETNELRGRGRRLNSNFSAHMQNNSDLAAPGHLLTVKAINLTHHNPN